MKTHEIKITLGLFLGSLLLGSVMAYTAKSEPSFKEITISGAPFELINDYQKMSKINDKRSKCVDAIMIAQKYLQIKDTDGHLQWKIIQQRDCKAYIKN